MSLIIIPVYGLPASGKSRIVTSVSKRLFDINTTNIAVIELDDILLQHQQQSSSSSSFDITKWFQAREAFHEKIQSKVSKWIATTASPNAKKKNYIIFAVDNLPLKSMRNRIKSQTIKTIRDTLLSKMNTSTKPNENDEHQEAKDADDEKKKPLSSSSFYFFPVGVTISKELALDRNAQRVEKIPPQIIEQMSSRIEHETDYDLVLDNSSPKADDVGKLETSVVEFVMKNFVALRCHHDDEQKNNSKYQVNVSTDEDDEINAKRKLANPEEFHRASRTIAHQFDLLRRQANASILKQISSSASSNNKERVQEVAKILSDKKFIEVDRKILTECGDDLEQAQVMLQMAREPLL